MKRPSAEVVEKLRQLSETTRELQVVDARGEELRRRRNLQVYEAVQAGATERKAAQEGDMDPSYAHRCVVTKGDISQWKP